MPDLSIFATPAPYHIITYGTLLGTQFYQSFVAGPIAYMAIPRPQFSALQTKTFPIYFAIQTALPAILALTYPGQRSPIGAPSSLRGTFAEANRWNVLAPIMTVFATGLVNLLFVGPATTRIMNERKQQGTKDGKKSYDPAPHSKEMQKLNKAFGKAHGASTLINLAGLVATIWYGVVIAGRLQ